jgi:hypothetical protein
MAEVPHPFPTCRALYGNPANNPFSLDDETQERCYSVIFKTFRATHAPLSIDELLRNILADFSRNGGPIGVSFGWKLPVGQVGAPAWLSVLPRRAGPQS